MLAGPAAAQAERITPDEFRLRINDAFGCRGMKLQLQPWVPSGMGPAVLKAAVTRNIAAIAEMDSDDRLSAVLFVMRTGRTLESVMQVVATLAATTYAGNPELSEADRLGLLDELGLFEQEWGQKGLAGTAVRNGVTYLVVHPGGDPLVIFLVSWPARREPSRERVL